MKLFSCLFLSMLPLFGWAQEFEIDDIASDRYFLKKAGTNSFEIVYEVNGSKGSLFRKVQFDILLQPLHTSEISLYGNHQLVATADNGAYTAYGFLKKEAARIILHIEKDGQRTYQLFIPLPPEYPSKKIDVKLLPIANETGFIVLHRSGRLTWQFTALTMAGVTLWKQEIRAERELDFPHVFTLQDKVVVIKRENYKNRNKRDVLFAFDPLTGKEIMNTSLSVKKGNASIDRVFFKDSTLYLSGRRFTSNRISNSKTGMPYLKCLSPSLQLTDLPLHTSLAAMKFLWADIVPDENGRLYLVGETFQSENYGAYMLRSVAIGMATLGIFTVTWCNLKFNDVILAPLERPDVFPEIMKLPQKKVTVGIHLPSYQFAQYACNTGQMRFWGADSNGSIYLLQDKTLIKKTIGYSNPVSIGTAPLQKGQVALYASGGQLLTCNPAISNHRLTFRIVPLVP